MVFDEGVIHGNEKQLGQINIDRYRLAVLL